MRVCSLTNPVCKEPAPCYIVICSLQAFQYFGRLPHERNDYRGGIGILYKYKMCVSNFSTKSDSDNFFSLYEEFSDDVTINAKGQIKVTPVQTLRLCTGRAANRE